MPRCSASFNSFPGGVAECLFTCAVRAQSEDIQILAGPFHKCLYRLLGEWKMAVVSGASPLVSWFMNYCLFYFFSSTKEGVIIFYQSLKKRILLRPGGSQFGWGNYNGLRHHASHDVVMQPEIFRLFSRKSKLPSLKHVRYVWRERRELLVFAASYTFPNSELRAKSWLICLVTKCANSHMRSIFIEGTPIHKSINCPFILPDVWSTLIVLRINLSWLSGTPRLYILIAQSV